MKAHLLFLYDLTLIIISFLNYSCRRKKINDKISRHAYTQPLLISPRSFKYSAENSRFNRFHGFIFRNLILAHPPEIKSMAKNIELLSKGFENIYIDLELNRKKNPFYQFYFALKGEKLANSKFEELLKYRQMFMDFQQKNFLYSNRVFSRNNLSIGINDDGGFIYLTGKHRIAMAQVTKLPYIPVQVSFRTKIWNEKRLKINQAIIEDELEEWMLEYLNHPDIAK